MSRITGVLFSDGLLFEEQTHSGPTLPANDVLPLTGPFHQAFQPDPASIVDPLGATTHLYSSCYAGWGRWEVQQLHVTNNDSFPVFFTFAKMPKATYKDTGTHAFTRYTGNPPAAADKIDVRTQAPFWAIPIPPARSFVTGPDWKFIVMEGESLWAGVYPGWPFGSLAELNAPPIGWKIATLRVTGDILV